MAALRKFCGWLEETGYVVEAPEVPKVSKQTAGTPHTQRTRSKAPPLSPEEVEAVLDLLPEYSDRMKFPVKSRFEVAYDTTLRPETLSRLRVPENWSPGCTEITLTDADDKELYARHVPLTQRAIDALARVAPEEGLIFGDHRYLRFVREAAKKALPAAKAAIFTGQHFRSAAITHYLEWSGNLPAVMGMAGHKHASTTGLYVRTSLRASREMLIEVERVKIRVKTEKVG